MSKPDLLRRNAEAWAGEFRRQGRDDDADRVLALVDSGRVDEATAVVQEILRGGTEIDE